MALSDVEWDMVLKAWAPVEADAAGHGAEVLTRLFKAHSGTQLLFPKFRSLTAGELVGNEELAAHGSIVVKKLGEMLKRRGKHADVLRPLAQTHVHTHKIPPDNFKHISGIFVQLMKEKVSGFGADSEAAMNKALAAVVSDMGTLYKELGFAG
ncbi:myoglobin [Lepisosteus oculatus]|uniref:myoglobin n=1 Tax=Lepisosteus oculatus TaxID=7918 RepID=UPI0035F50D51